MSGAVAAHASYNGSGTQGLAVTNKISANDSDVMSVFYNKNDTTRQLLYGSSVMEIPTSGVSGTTSWGGNQIFTVNNDIDALGDLYIQVGVKCSAHPTTSKSGGGLTAEGQEVIPDGYTFNNFGLASIIERVEFQVGTQIWQTLENDDILACNCTELGEGVFKKFGAQANGFVKTNGAELDTAGRTASLHVPNNINGLGNSLERAHGTNVSLGDSNDVYTHNLISGSGIELETASSTVHGTATAPAGYSLDALVNTGRSTLAGGFQKVLATSSAPQSRSMFLRLPLLTKTMAPELQGFTENTENGYLMAAAPHQSVKIKVYFTDDLSKVFTSTHESVVPTAAQVSIEPGKLYGRCMIMCNEEREMMKSQPQGIPKRLKMTQNVNKSQESGLDSNFTLDLDHFSLYSSHFIITVTGEPGCGLDTAELKLNSSSFSGTIDAQLLDGTTASSLGLVSNSLDNVFSNNMRDPDQSKKSIYIFPLASRAYGGSSVPLNRFDNIRLVLSFSKEAKATSVNVTCIGETTSTFKGGASSLAMY